eukprot:RCo018572
MARWASRSLCVLAVLLWVGVCGAITTGPATCSDGIQDGDEQGVDCGGSCPNPCLSVASSSVAPETSAVTLTGVSASVRRFEIAVQVISDATPVSGLAWAVFRGTNPLFQLGRNASRELMALAEDGDPTQLLASLQQALSPWDKVLSSVGVAYATPASPGPSMVNQTTRFAVSATPGDQLSFVMMFQRSNDFFFSTAPAGYSLFDASGNPMWNASIPLFLYDAGTEIDQGYWANYYLGQQSTQPGGGSFSGTVITQQLGTVALLNDSLYTGLLPYPRPETVLLAMCNKGFDVILQPNSRGYEGGSVLVEFTFDTIFGLGNEIHLHFPPDFTFHRGNATATGATLLQGFAPSTPAPDVLIQNSTVMLQWAANVTFSAATVFFQLTNLGFPNNCLPGLFTFSTKYCTTHSSGGAGVYRDCSSPTSFVSAVVPDGAPTQCTICNACKFLYTHPTTGEAVFQCEDSGVSFTRRSPSPDAMAAAPCAVNPYSLPGYG